MVADPPEAEDDSGPKDLDEAAKTKLRERDAERRCGTVWLAVLLRRLIVRGNTSTWLVKWIESLCRAFVRVTSDTSMFTADVGLKALCFLYSVCPADGRAELMKTMFSSFSNNSAKAIRYTGAGPADAASRKGIRLRMKAHGWGAPVLPIPPIHMGSIRPLTCTTIIPRCVLSIPDDHQFFIY